jgi:hypothetical protein
MRRYFGRLFTGTKAHLVQIARILDFPADAVQLMRGANDEECEATFLSHVAGRWGGPVDWRGGASDIYEVLEPCLSHDERRHLPPVNDVQAASPAQVVEVLDGHLRHAPRSLRALDSLGDFVIVLLVPRDRLAEFDHAARFWAA